MNPKFMKLAIEQAKKGKTPFGCVIVDKDDNIIAKSYNTVRRNKNAIYHAEINTIVKTCRKLKTWNLEDCELYTTCMPCGMCAGAIHWARIKKIYFGCTIKDVKEFGYNEMDSEITLKILENHQIESGILREECYSLLVNYSKEVY